MKWQKTASYERLKCIEHVLAATQYWRRFHEDLMLIHWLFTLIWRQCSAATANQADVTRACATQRRVCDVISRWADVALQMRAIKIWRPICGRIQKRRATDASARFTQRRATHDVVTSQRWIAFMTSWRHSAGSRSWRHAWTKIWRQTMEALATFKTSD